MLKMEMMEEKNFEIPAHDDPDIFDPACDPSNPVSVDLRMIEDAVVQIKDDIKKTSCFKSSFSSEAGMIVYFKNEYEQATGSFKERGACNALKNLTQDQKNIGAIAASTGNFASSISYHAAKLGIPVTVVMPTMAPSSKVNKCVSFGAKVILKGDSIEEAKRVALKISKICGMVYINGSDNKDVMAGQGTVALEILEQVPNVDAIIVPVGGGALLAGVATAVKLIKPDCHIYGVESDRCPSMSNALSAGGPVHTSGVRTVADGLFVPVVGVNSFFTAKPLIDRMITVDDDHVVRAIMKILQVEKTVVEGAGAISLGAIMANAVPELKGKTVVCILSGSNIDPIVLGRVIDRASVLEGRLIRICLTLPEIHGSISEFCKDVTDQGVGIREIHNDRYHVKTGLCEMRVQCILEAKDKAHGSQLHAVLIKKYPKMKWGSPN